MSKLHLYNTLKGHFCYKFSLITLLHDKKMGTFNKNFWHYRFIFFIVTQRRIIVEIWYVHQIFIISITRCHVNFKLL